MRGARGGAGPAGREAPRTGEGNMESGAGEGGA